MKPKPPACVLLLCLAVAATARAEVTDSADHGFTLRIERRITASPTETWTRLVDEVGAWWHPDHTFSGNAGNLSIDARAQGCFCEQLEPEGEGRHLTVVFAQPGKRLRLTGGLGPLQGYGLAGSLNFELEPDGEGTRLTLSYAVGGYVAGGLAGWAPAVDEVLTAQMDRFTRYVATGRPAE
jgi:uncharacterized protein YndB with AHSA1/START domain